MHKQYQTVSCEGHVAIVWSKEKLSYERGTASADHIGNGIWWVNRVIVSKSHRRKGIGSKLVQMLKKEVSKQDGFTILEVAPGGYDLHYKAQEAFYLKQGFIKKDNSLLEWTNSRKV